MQFFLDGQAVGNEDTTSPYSFSWDSTTASNGNHTLTAVARDAAGNKTTSAAQSITVQNNVQAPSGLVAAYSFDQGSGSVLSDLSGNGNNGSILNATWTTAGKFGSALSFNGSNARVDIADSSSLRLTSAMTLEAWVRPTAIDSSWRDIIFKGNDNYYLMASSNNGSLPVGGIIAGGSYAESFGTSALSTDSWVHLASTYDGSALRLYVNGTQVSSVAKSGTILTSDNPLQLGGDSIYGQYFSGLIDEIRIYNRALTASEIQSDMNASVGGVTGGDSTAPTVSLTGPGAGSTVSGTVAVSATASDDVGVVGVQFFLDGQAVGNEDTTSPYSFSWDTTQIASGNHTLTAVAPDASG